MGNGEQMETIGNPENSDKAVEAEIVEDAEIAEDSEKKEETMAGLKSSEGFLRRMLAKNLNLRNTPELIFIADDSIAYGIRMSKLIDEVNHAADAPEE